MMSTFFNLWLRVYDQYPMDHTVSFSCFCSITHLTSLPHASASSVLCPIKLGKGCTAEYTSASLKAFISDDAVNLFGPKLVG